MSEDIVGYTYKADIYCPRCIVQELPTGPRETFDGWKDLTNTSTEGNLDEIASAFGIARHDEATFDSGDFPKVVFWHQTEDDHCGRCGEVL